MVFKGYISDNYIINERVEQLLAARYSRFNVNELLVIHLLLLQDLYSAQVAEVLQVDTSRVTNIMSHLLSRGIVEQLDKRSTNHVGTKPRRCLYRLTRNGRAYAEALL